MMPIPGTSRTQQDFNDKERAHLSSLYPYWARTGAFNVYPNPPDGQNTPHIDFTLMPEEQEWLAEHGDVMAQDALGWFDS